MMASILATTLSAIADCATDRKVSDLWAIFLILPAIAVEAPFFVSQNSDAHLGHRNRLIRFAVAIAGVATILVSFFAAIQCAKGIIESLFGVETWLDWGGQLIGGCYPHSATRAYVLRFFYCDDAEPNVLRQHIWQEDC